MKTEQLDKRDYNFKREYECKLCHKMNRSSYVCTECRNALQGISKAIGRGKSKVSRKCINCGCTLNNKQSSALRCRDCSFAINQRRHDLRLKLESNQRTISLLESGKGEPVGREQRIVNLKLHRQKLLLRLHQTYVNTVAKEMLSDGGINIPQQDR